MARKLRYAIYDTWQHKYLETAIQVTGSSDQLHTKWTARREKAQLFPGIKSADAMLEKLGRVSELVIMNLQGGIVG